MATTHKAPKKWIEAVEEGRADNNAGLTCNGEVFLAELKAEDDEPSDQQADDEKVRSRADLVIEPAERARRLEWMREELRLAREEVAAGQTCDLESLLAEWAAEDATLEQSSAVDHQR